MKLKMKLKKIKKNETVHKSSIKVEADAFTEIGEDWSSNNATADSY